MHILKTMMLALMLIIFSVVAPLAPIFSSVANASENAKFRLTVNATPSDSRIRIMNIKPKYQHGIALEPGKYDIEVTRSGYESKRGWVEIKDADLTIDVILSKLGAKEQQVNEVISSEADDAALIQYALQLRKTKPKLFSGAQGILIIKVEPNSQAEKKGLRRGDIVIAYNGQQMNSAEQFVSTVQANADKPQVKLQFIRAEIIQVVVLQRGQIGIHLTDITEEEVSLQRLKHLLYEGWQADSIGDYLTAVEKWEQGLIIARQANDQKRIAPFTNLIGALYRDIGKYELALNYYQQSLAIHRSLQNRVVESWILGDIGMIYNNLGQYERAIDYRQKALTISREFHDSEHEVKNLNGIGLAYFNLEQYERAIDYYQQTLVLSREPNTQEEGINLTNLINGIGLAYSNLEQYERAIDYYQQALTLSRELNNTQHEGINLTHLGRAYMELGQYERAQNFHQQALSIHRQLYDRKGEGYNLGGIGEAYYNLEQYEDALKSYQHALLISYEIHDSQIEGEVLSGMAAISLVQDQYEKALNYLQKALKINNGNHRLKCNNFNDMGAAYTELGQYENALNFYQQALILARKVNYLRGEGHSLGNIGRLYSDQGQYEHALNYLQQSLYIHRKIKARKDEAGNLSNLCSVYQMLGKNEPALNYCQQSLRIYKEINYRNGIRDISNNIGVTYYYQKQYELALNYFQQSLTISVESKSLKGHAFSLSNIGLIYRYMGENEWALNFHKEAIKLHREIKMRQGEGISLLHVSAVYLSQRQYELALSHLYESLAIFQELKELDHLRLAQTYLAIVQTKRRKFGLAISYYEQALNNIEKLRSELTEKEHKISFMRDKLHVYDDLIALLQSLHPNHPKKGYDRKAIEIFERKQGRVFLEEMGKSGARRFAGIPENIVQNEIELVQKIEAARKSRTESLAQSKDAEPHRKRLEKLQAEQTDFEKTLQKDYPAYYALKYPKPVALKTLQKDVLKSDELMLIYNVRKKATDLWVVGKEHFAMFTLPLTEEQMQQQVTKFRDVGIESMLSEIDTANQRKLKNAALIRHIKGAVEENLPDFVETSHALYQQLLPKIVREFIAKAKPSTLYIVPTSALYSLPFGSLVTEPDEDEPHYLLQDYAIAYLSSASLLKTLRDAQHRRELTEREPLLAFADPVYPQDKSCKELSQGHSIKGMRTRAYQTLLGGEGTCFPSLPETADEAKAIAKLFNVKPNSQPKPLNLQENASVETVYSFNKYEELDDFQYVLFSTHAILPDEVSYIKQPALVLSHPEQNGYLKMADVFGLKMNADLVTLSACNTGRGDAIRGEGVRGLTRAFMYAGTPAVAVTLWSVESQASKQLGINLFTQLKNKQPLAKGLQQAKLAMLKNDKSHSRHPYFWAGFVVFGDGR